jgi:broad specificity phosphatase PhoE
MSEIYLIRHGQASFGAENYDRLSELGVRQGRLLGRHFAHLQTAFDAAYCGCLERQRKTAEAFAEAYRGPERALPPTLTAAAFDEYDSFAVWETLLPVVLAEDPALARDGQNFQSDRKAFQRLFSRVMSRWVGGGIEAPGVPRWVDFKARVRQGMEEVAAAQGAGKRVAVFTSGGPIAVAVQSALGLADQAAIELSWQVMNASVTRLKYSRRGMALSGFNDIAHLELEKDSSLLTYR